MEYTDGMLEELRLDYLKRCKPTRFRLLNKDGTLDRHLQRSAIRCRERANTLILTGTAEEQAWQWAIREVLLETEAD